MACESSSYDKLEIILQDRSSGPQNVPLEYLRKITKDFSDKHLLGEGGFGKVYKGVLQNEKMIAVKKLEQLKPGVQDRQFENEVYHLMKLKHPNIVRFVGYCYETRNECVEYNGKYIFAEMQQRLLCLEYLPNGSLDGHLSDEYSGLDWHTRYRIIKGICHGLHYLHEECKCQINASIIHLDLKPANILLDENMVPKIADFGLSRLFEDKKTQTCTSTLAGSLGYMAPEYIYRCIITAKADMYSLGVIIVEIITGSKIDPFSFTTSCQDFVEPVLKNWRNRLEAAPSETDCKQIKGCLEIGLSCVKINRDERPTTKEIMEMLNRWESTNGYVNNEKLPADKVSNSHSVELLYNQPVDELWRVEAVSESGHHGAIGRVIPTFVRGSEDIEAQTNILFRQMISGQMSTTAMIQMLARFKQSKDTRELSIFSCMISNLFEEYKLFRRYPDTQLKLLAVLYGSLIKHHLVADLALGIALQKVLDALRKPVDSKMFTFGTTALEQFMDRVIEWPQYCNHILQISHLRVTHAESVSAIEQALGVLERYH